MTFVELFIGVFEINLGAMTNAKASSLAFPFDLDAIQIISVGLANRKISSRMTVL